MIIRKNMTVSSTRKLIKIWQFTTNLRVRSRNRCGVLPFLSSMSGRTVQLAVFGLNLPVGCSGANGLSADAGGYLMKAKKEKKNHVSRNNNVCVANTRCTRCESYSRERSTAQSHRCVTIIYNAIYYAYYRVNYTILLLCSPVIGSGPCAGRRRLTVQQPQLVVHGVRAAGRRHGRRCLLVFLRR